MKLNTLKLFALSAVTAAALTTQAHALTVKDDQGKVIDPSKIESITISTQKIPEINGFVVKDNNLLKFIALGDKFEAATGKSAGTLLKNNAALLVKLKDGTVMTLGDLSGGVATLKAPEGKR